MEVVRKILGNKWLRVGVLAGLILVFILSLKTNLTNGQITVTTNDQGNSISLIRTEKDKRETVLKTGGSRLSASLPAGTYTVSVHNRVAEARQTVAIKARQESEYNIDLKEPSVVEPVLPTGAYGIADSSSQLQYVDSATGALKRLDQQGLPQSVDSAHSYKSVKWSGDAFGIGQASDGRLYTIKTGVVQELPLPRPYQKGITINYSVDTEKNVYVSIGHEIYLGKEGVNFKKIYTAGSDSPLFTAGKGRLAIQDSVKKPEGESRSGEDSGYESLLVIISGGKRLASREIGASEISWSPDGTYLAVVGDTTNSIYDSSLKQVRTLHGGNFTNLAWLNDNVLLYGVGATLWAYRLDTRQSEVLANMPLFGNVAGVYPSTDGSYVYVSAQKSNDSSDYNLGRIGLTHAARSVPDYVATLGIFFPSHTDQCGFSYINFTRPLILITSWTNTDTCLDAAKEELKADKLPMDKLNIVFDSPYVD